MVRSAWVSTAFLFFQLSEVVVSTGSSKWLHLGAHFNNLEGFGNVPLRPQGNHNVGMFPGFGNIVFFVAPTTCQKALEEGPWSGDHLWSLQKYQAPSFRWILLCCLPLPAVKSGFDVPFPLLWALFLVGLKCDKGLFRKSKRKKRSRGREATWERSVNKTQDPDPCGVVLVHWPGGTWRTSVFLCLDVIKAYSTRVICLERRGKPHLSWKQAV